MALETLSLGFLKPNILRPVLYNETASSDKVGCMEKAVRDMTSFETGVRLAGLPDFQVYDSITSLPINKSIQVDYLSEGVAKIFPLAFDSNLTNNIDDAFTPSSSSPISHETP